MPAHLHRRPVRQTMRNGPFFYVSVICEVCESHGVGWSRDPDEASNIATMNLMSWECPKTPTVGPGSMVIGNGASYIAGEERRPAG